MPWDFKDYQGQEKGLLRYAMQGVLPNRGCCGGSKSPYPKTWNPAYLAAVSAELRRVISDPAAPLLAIIKRRHWKYCWPAGPTTAVPWYGQLMTTPQTIA